MLLQAAQYYHLPPSELIRQDTSGELERELGKCLNHEEHPEEFLGGPEFEDVEAPVGPPKECGEHIECLCEGEYCEIPVRESLTDGTQ